MGVVVGGGRFPHPASHHPAGEVIVVIFTVCAVKDRHPRELAKDGRRRRVVVTEKDTRK